MYMLRSDECGWLGHTSEIFKFNTIAINRRLGTKSTRFGGAITFIKS